MIRVAAIDNHPTTIEGIQSVLSAVPDIVITGTYQTGSALLDGIRQDMPDVLLLDIMLPDTSGKDLALILSKEYPSVRILALTSLDSPGHLKIMLKNGCAGYLLKDSDSRLLIKAIRDVHEGVEFIDPAIKDKMLQHMLQLKQQGAEIPELTHREKQILKLIVQEYTSQEIAEKLFISQRTVETHRFSISQKLEVKNLVGLIKVAIQMGLLEEE